MTVVPPPPIDARCDHCRYWHDVGDHQMGQCRVHPPVAQQHYPVGRWPITKSTDWCGAFAIDPQQVAAMPLQPSPGLLKKLAGIVHTVVHRRADSSSPLDVLCRDAEVIEWARGMHALGLCPKPSSRDS